MSDDREDMLTMKREMIAATAGILKAVNAINFDDNKERLLEAQGQISTALFELLRGLDRVSPKFSLDQAVKIVPEQSYFIPLKLEDVGPPVYKVRCRSIKGEEIFFFREDELVHANPIDALPPARCTKCGSTMLKIEGVSVGPNIKEVERVTCLDCGRS